MINKYKKLIIVSIIGGVLFLIGINLTKSETLIPELPAATTTPTIVRWLKTTPNPEEIFKQTGVKVKRISNGMIRVGGDDRNPITIEGVEVEFDTIPATTSIEKLDAIFPELTREVK